MAAYPSGRVSEATSGVYEAMLADIDRDVASAAVQRLIATSKFLPTIAELRAACADVQHGPRRRGEEAWGDVVAAIRHVGVYAAPPEFRDPLVGECVRLMSWRGLCLGDNEAADRAKFVSLYDGLATRAREDVVAGKALPQTRPVGALPWSPRQMVTEAATGVVGALVAKIGVVK